MECTQGNLAALFTGLKGMFLDGVQEAKVAEALSELSAEVSSDKGTEEYPTVALLGDLEELLDEYTFTAIGNFIQSVQNLFFGRMLEIPRSKIEDDSLGLYKRAVQALGRLAGVHPYRRIPNLFILGFTTAWIDGANLFSSSHVWPGGQTWDNLDTLPLTHGGYRIARQHLRERVGPDSVPMGLVPTHLICGPANETRAKEILVAEHLAGGATNVDTFDQVKPVIWSQLCNNTRLGVNASYYWFLIAAREGSKPVIVQNRDAPALVAQDQPTDNGPFRRERYEYKASRRYGLALALPHLVQAVQATEDTTTTTAAA